MQGDDGFEAGADRTASSASGAFSSRAKRDLMAAERRRLRWTMIILLIPLALMAFLFHRTGRISAMLRDVREVSAGHNGAFGNLANRITSLERNLEAVVQRNESLAESNADQEAAIARLNMLMDGILTGQGAASAPVEKGRPPARRAVRQIDVDGRGSQIDYGELIKGYLDDTDRYDKEYKGKTIVVSVRVGGVRGTPSSLAAAGKFCIESKRASGGWVRCIFPDGEGGAISVDPDAAVLIRGSVLGMHDDGVVYLRDCMILEWQPG